jgi:hypothetical protein
MTGDISLEGAMGVIDIWSSVRYEDSKRNLSYGVETTLWLFADTLWSWDGNTPTMGDIGIHYIDSNIRLPEEMGYTC